MVDYKEGNSTTLSQTVFSGVLKPKYSHKFRRKLKAHETLQLRHDALKHDGTGYGEVFDNTRRTDLSTGEPEGWDYKKNQAF